MKTLLYKQDGETLKADISDLTASTIATNVDQKKSWKLEINGLWTGTFNYYDFVGLREYKEPKLTPGKPMWRCSYGVLHDMETPYGKCNCSKYVGGVNSAKFEMNMKEIGIVMIGGLVDGETPLTKEQTKLYRETYLKNL